jgi:hypothetical protein
VRPNHFAVLEVDDAGDRGLGLDAALPPAGAEAADRDDPIAEVAELGKLVTKARHGVAVGLERLADTLTSAVHDSLAAEQRLERVARLHVGVARGVKSGANRGPGVPAGA